MYPSDAPQAGRGFLAMPFDHPFVHLHVHTEFSLLDGLSKIDKLVARAQALEMKSLAITDHGTMHGVIQFYRACKTASIKPIIGMESYLAKKNRFVHDVTEKQPYHLLLIAKNAIGYKNLLKLASAAQLTGFYGKPRVDRDLLAEYHEGLICTSGCLAAEIPRAFEDGRETEAFKMIGTYQDIFGKDNFFLELQEHDIPQIKLLNEWLVRTRGKADVPLLATNDVHYVLDSDFNAHDTLLCIQTNALKRAERRMRMSDASYHLRTPDEMWTLFGDVAPEAIENTLRVAEMVDLNLDTEGYHLPKFPVPEGYTADSFLRALALRGALWRYGEDGRSQRILDRLDYELGIINQMGFDTYFLIVWDLCEFARKADIWWNVRGSGAGSAVAYCLGITSIDPIQNNLIFERFLNPGRISMPDIDMDFPDDRRSEMIDYAKRKYGEDKVAAIITFSTLKARAAIKDVGRALDIPLAQVNELTKMIPAIPSHPVTLVQCLSDDPEYAVPDLIKQYDSSAAIHELLDMAMTVEGVARGVGTHAAGIIIGDAPLVEYLPLHRPTGDDVAINRVTQFPMEVCEAIGLLKVDFLGLSTLTIMRKACELIERYHGIHYTLANIPYRPNPDDPEQSKMVAEAFELIGTGEVTGVFQLESQGMRKMLVEMLPKTFEHITAAISLYRPGPMQFIPMYNKRMHGEEKIEYLHPKLVSILSETYGVITYQEQIQRIGADLFGYSLGEADMMRRAVSKKKAKDLAKHKHIFIEQGPEHGVSADVAEKIYEQVEYFAAYGFNKCVTSGTEIVDATTGRIVKIGDLATGSAHIDETLTCDTERLRLKSGTVAEVHANGVKPVYRLTTNLGRQIEATINHPFYTFGGWRLLGELSVGDKIAVPRRIPVEGSREWPDHEVIVLGHLLAEGNLCHPHGLYYYTSDDDQWRDYVRHLEQFENVSASTHFRRNNMHDVYGRKINAAKPNSSVLWIEKLGLRNTTSYTKFIPDEAFELTNRQIALLIARMWEGDGNITEKDRFVYYATSSERLAHQLQHLLLRLGIISRIRRVEFKYRDGRIGYQIHVYGNENLKTFQNTIASHFVSDERREKLNRMIMVAPASSGTKDCVPIEIRDVVRQHKANKQITWNAVAVGAGISITEFQKPSNTTKAGFTHAVIGRLAEYFDSDELRNYAKNDVYWDAVVSIEYVGEQPTYDLTIPDTHNFVANDIIVHNSHAADYAVITCQTAFLKRHYAPEYYTALLSVQRDKIEDVTLFTSDCRRLGIPILPPDVNHSELDFTIEETDRGRGIRFGLGAIKGCGERAAQAIADERIAHGPYHSLVDFCQRVDLKFVGKRALEPLVKVGALDMFGGRDHLLAVVERLTKYSEDHHAAKRVGQYSIFGDTSEDSDDTFFRNLPKITESGTREHLRWEKDLIGLYVSDHPLNALMGTIDRLPNIFTGAQIKADAEAMHDKAVTVAGLVVGIRTIITKKGDAMAIVSLEDVGGMLDTVFFPRTWTRYREDIKEDQVYIIRGKADTRRGGDPQVIVESVTQDFDVTMSDDDQPGHSSNGNYAPPASYQPAASHDAGVDGTGEGTDEGTVYYYGSTIPDQDEVTNTQEPEPPPRNHGNGSSDGNHSVQPPTYAASPSANSDSWSGFDEEAPAAPARLVIVRFPSSNGSREAWVRRIRRIHGLLIQCPGNDMFVFQLPDGEGIFNMEIPERIDFDRAESILQREFKETPNCWTVAPLTEDRG